MKSKKIIFLVSSLLSGIFMTGCKQTTANISNDNDIRFDTIMINEQYHLLGDSMNPSCTLESSFIYPSDYKDKEILRKINRHFLISFFGEDNVSASPEDAMASYTNKYISEYKEIEKDFLDARNNTEEKSIIESSFTYHEMSSNEILYNKCNLISYAVAVEYFTGGAHGEQGYNNYVIYLKTGDALEEKDLFADNYQDDLARIIVDAIAADHHVTDPAELENMGFFNIKEIYPNNNFYVDGNGITYTFNHYEIAAYSVGKIDVALPYDKIRHLMRENSPVAPLAVDEK
ncbi:MAG: RsiV family protein [Tannerella sp.]|jgi:hypothetical protein|nr:RsiV family protein [Tannerella sp.]